MGQVSVGTRDRFAGYVHDQIGRIIGQMDTKAQILLALASGSLVYLATELEVFTSFYELVQGNVGSIDEVVATMASVLLMLGFGSAVVCVTPRFGDAKGIVFFMAIAKFRSGGDYAHAIDSTPEDGLVSSVLEDAHALARIARGKAFWAAWANSLIVVGLIAMVLATYLRAISS